MASSDTRDLAITTSDWKQHQSHQHGSPAEYPQESNVMRRIIIRSYNDAPEPIIKMGKPINPYSDPELERSVFGGLTYEEFDKRFRQLQSLSSDPNNKDLPYNISHNINFQAFPESETWNTVYLPLVRSKEHFNKWVERLIVQMKIAGLERLIPSKRNDWSSELLDNGELSEAIIFMWKKCIPEECCPAWVEFTPYNTEDSPNVTTFELLAKYNRRNKNREIWREAIKQTDKNTTSSELRKLWKEGNNVYRNFFCSKKHHDFEMLLECLEQMMIENYANKCDKLKRELEKNEDIDLPTALKLLHTESKKPVKSKSNYNRREDKASKKSPTKTSNSWNRAYNGTNRYTKSGKNCNKYVTTKKKGKVYYIE
ncbi:transposon Ty2-F/Ty2-GR2 Gag polyprotein [Kluyveromyces marxianus]|uniref:Transposon Ty2-F/Ty2-GR2 Gag polyprotein n=1 Tax=Kluyveromyces marxianus TaxID=4911 RepID=A0ABX6EPU8_KLUMA|nr:transposon Ty2-F/Ty2-GR2 Gag polyprotein [Kluyveromyces marxianus]